MYQGRKLNGILFSNEMTGGVLDGQIQLFKGEFCQEKRINIPVLKEILHQELSATFIQNLEALMVSF